MRHYDHLDLRIKKFSLTGLSTFQFNNNINNKSVCGGVMFIYIVQFDVNTDTNCICSE